MILLDLNNQNYNTVILQIYGAQAVSVSADGLQNTPLNVGSVLNMSGWQIQRKDAESLSLRRPQSPDAAPITLKFNPEVSIVAEAWLKGRSPTKLRQSQLESGITELQCSLTQITTQGSQQPAGPMVEELNLEITALRDALALQGRIADVGLAGAERLRDQLTAELSQVQQRRDELDALNELKRVDLERAQAHVRELEADLQVVEDAIRVGSNPGYQAVPFVKLLNRAKTAMTNLQDGLALLVLGKEILLDKRGRAVVTNGMVSSEDDQIPDLPENITPQDQENDEVNHYQDIYHNDTDSN